MHRRNAHREDVSRQHPTRAAILALLARDQKTMSAAQIRAELPGQPGGAAIVYHLKVLGEMKLISTADGCYKLF